MKAKSNREEYRFKVTGERAKNKNEGKFSLGFNARVVTNFSGWGPLMRPVWAMYSYLFYNRIRRKYVEQCRNYLLNLVKMVKEHYNIEYTDTPMSKGF